MAGAEGNTRRIVLLGKTGSGKSSLANTMFGEDVFKVSSSANSVTNSCQSETRTINGRSIKLIDTPGLFDTNIDSTELTTELLNSINECLPGPHAFLLVLKVERYTQQEEAVVDLLVKEYFGEGSLKYTTVVFTHGDQLDEGVEIKDWLQENKSLKDLVDKCGGRCCVIDSKYWNNSQDPYRNNQYQIEQLLKTIDQTLRENNGGYYTNEMLQGMQEIKEKEGNVWSLKKILIGVGVGVVVGAFLGGLAGAVLLKYFASSAMAVKCAAVGKVVIGAALGKGVIGGAVGGGVLGAAGGLAVGAVGAVGVGGGALLSRISQHPKSE